jgi:trigger factor
VKLTVERMPESQVRLDITADDDEFAKAMDQAYRKVSREITLPGFRKGKAPRVMIERYYGRSIFLEEAHKEIMDDLYRRALEQESLSPVGSPDVDITAIEPVGFTVTVPVYPDIDPGPYTDVRVEPADASINESEVDEVLERLRKSQSPWVDPAEPRTPREGDQVTVDITVVEGEDQFQEPVEGAEFILGESNIFTGLREQLEQMQVDETRTFDLTFADDDETVNERIRGKTLTYTVTLRGLKERDLLELNDEFAQSVGETETLDALRQEIREDLHRGKTNEKRNEVLDEIIRRIAEGETIDLPAIMVDEAVDSDVNALRGRLAQQRMPLETYLRQVGQTEEEMRAEMRPEAERRLRNSLILREIAEREGIEVTEADLEAEIDRLVEGAAEADQMRQVYSGDYFKRMLSNQLFEQRISDRLIEIATEGRGATSNGWTPPEPSADSNATGTDTALTTGTMEGQPGDVAATATSEDPDAAVSVGEVAREGMTSDVEQAASVGHESENIAVAEEAPEEAVTPEELEAQGEPGNGGTLPNPTH